jgi:hypothetical protein
MLEVRKPMISLGLKNSESSKSTEPSPIVTKALAETARWCSDEQSLSHQLRSPKIDPSAALQRPHLPETQESIQAWVQVRNSQYRQAVSQVTAQRSHLLAAMKVSTLDSDAAQAHGQLLIYFPMETVSCGASAASTQGFFDGKDAPPWDTWFWYSDGGILSWVPEDFVSRAQAGIDANPVDCIHWADWRDLPRLTR